MLPSQEIILPKSGGRFLRGALTLCFVIASFALYSSSVFAECGRATQRIEFPKGAAKTEIKGTLRNRRAVCKYVFRAQANQVMDLNFVRGKMAVRVYLPSGEEMNPLDDGIEAYDGSASLEETGDYRIELYFPHADKLSPKTASFQFRLGVRKNPYALITQPGSQVKFLNANFQSDENAPRRIAFVKGKSSVKLTGTLRRTKTIDDVHYYVLRANARQTLTLRVTATSGTAVFSVWTPDNENMLDGMDDRFSAELPVSGDYRIHVWNPGNGNLGNTRYTLTVSIK